MLICFVFQLSFPWLFVYSMKIRHLLEAGVFGTFFESETGAKRKRKGGENGVKRGRNCSFNWKFTKFTLFVVVLSWALMTSVSFRRFACLTTILAPRPVGSVSGYVWRRSSRTQTSRSFATGILSVDRRSDLLRVFTTHDDTSVQRLI